MRLKAKSPDGYTILLNKVRKTLIEGQRRIEQERVRTYWETGRLIHTDILKHKDRAQYGAQVVKSLAGDLNLHPRILRRCIQFAKAYPRLPIVTGRSQFNWTHYRELAAVSDDKKRLSWERAALKNAWTADELAFRIKRDRPALTTIHQRPFGSAQGRPATSDNPLIPLRGMLYTYKLVKRDTVSVGEEAELLVDLGFGIFRNVESRLLSAFSSGDIVASQPRDDAYKFAKASRTAKDLYTYAALVEKVIDGDTLKVRLDLGFDIWTRQTLRLRGIDCPELDTSVGQQAKTFVQSHIKEAQKIIVRSSRSDKYDRYLADVFIPSNESAKFDNKFGETSPKSKILAGDQQPAASDGIYLNNLLLEHGHAVRAGQV